MVSLVHAIANNEIDPSTPSSSRASGESAGHPNNLNPRQAAAQSDCLKVMRRLGSLSGSSGLNMSPRSPPRQEALSSPLTHTASSTRAHGRMGRKASDASSGSHSRDSAQLVDRADISCLPGLPRAPEQTGPHSSSSWRKMPKVFTRYAACLIFRQLGTFAA